MGYTFSPTKFHISVHECLNVFVELWNVITLCADWRERCDADTYTAVFKLATVLAEKS